MLIKEILCEEKKSLLKKSLAVTQNHEKILTLIMASLINKN
jgi:hypothetical protein